MEEKNNSDLVVNAYPELLNIILGFNINIDKEILESVIKKPEIIIKKPEVKK